MLKILPKFDKTKINPNSQEFYKKHPDLAPRNIYLATGRIISMKEVQKTIDNIGKESIWEKLGNLFSNLINKNK